MVKREAYDECLRLFCLVLDKIVTDMKNFIKLLLFVCGLLTASCSNDEESGDVASPKTPKATFYVNYQPVVRPNEMLIVTPSIYASESSEGCSIKKVDYYWDDMLIESSTKQPFTFSHRVENTNGLHKLVLLLNVGGTGYKDSLYTKRYDIEVSNYWRGGVIEPNKTEFKNGETIHLKTYWFEGDPLNWNKGWDKHKTRIYWDRYLLSETNESILEYDFKLFGELPGEHTLLFEYTIETYQDGRYIGGGSSGSQRIIYVSK